MIRVWFGLHWDEEGRERSCVIIQVLNEPERVLDARTGEPVAGSYVKLPNDTE